MFLILAFIVASASAFAYDMSRHNRSVVVHRLFSSSVSQKPMCPLKSPLSVSRHKSIARDNYTKLPQGYRMPNSTSRPVPNKTVPAEPVPAPAPAPRSLRH